MVWFILGLAAGLVLAYVIARSLSGRLTVHWYQWLLGVIAGGFVLLAVQNYLALQSELEPKLATFSLLAFGVPAVVAAALVWLIPALAGRGHKKMGEAKVRPA